MPVYYVKKTSTQMLLSIVALEKVKRSCADAELYLLCTHPTQSHFLSLTLY